MIVELKILPEVPHNVGYFLDDVAMPRSRSGIPTDHKDVRFLLKLMLRHA